MRCFRKWMKRRRPKDRQEYEVARRQADRVKREEIIRVWEKIRDDLKNDHSGKNCSTQWQISIEDIILR